MKLLEAQKRLRRNSVENIINDFADNKITMAAIERALGLPQRTLAKWKNENVAPSSTGIALLKFIRLFPWLLEVAEGKYDYDEAQKIMVDAGIRILLDSIHFSEAEDKKGYGIIRRSLYASEAHEGE